MSAQPSLALITGFGGINTAGRSSAHMAFQRVIFDVLNEQQQLETLTSLNQLMNLEGEPLDNQQTILQGSLIRGWDNVEWDAENIPFHQPFKNDAGEQCWRLTHKRLSVQSAGQTPKGFDPAAQYPSRHHPRGLQLTIYAASDAIASLGVEWDQLKQHVPPGSDWRVCRLRHGTAGSCRPRWHDSGVVVRQAYQHQTMCLRPERNACGLRQRLRAWQRWCNGQ